MGNIVAIAQKELRSYFASPIGYVVIGLFAVLFGFFFYAILGWFVQYSMRAGGGMMGPQVVNINQDMIRGLFGQTGVLMLFILPFVTMRTYAEEKRTGTMELLLTSPVTDFQIIMGKFLGALALYGVMLLVSALYIGLLFWFGNPEWRPVAAGYLGLLLLGASFIAFGLLVSSLTRNQIVAVAGTFALLLVLWIINWLGDSSGPTTQKILAHLSITHHLEEFTKGVIDTTHLIYYLSLITFGLFLTAKSVDSERWRG